MQNRVERYMRYADWWWGAAGAQKAMKRRRLGANLDIDRRIGQSLGQGLEVDVAGLAAGRLGALVLEMGRPQVLGLDGDPVDGGGREAGYRVPIDARLDRAHLHVVHADDVLVIAVARQPGYHGARRGDARGFDRGRADRHVLADHHCAGRVARRAPRVRHRAHAYPVRLRAEIGTRAGSLALDDNWARDFWQFRLCFFLFFFSLTRVTQELELTLFRLPIGGALEFVRMSRCHGYFGNS